MTGIVKQRIVVDIERTACNVLLNWRKREPTNTHKYSTGTHPFTVEELASMVRTEDGQVVQLTFLLPNFLYQRGDESFVPLKLQGGFHATLGQLIRIETRGTEHDNYTIGDPVGDQFIGEGVTVVQFLQLYPDHSPMFMVKRRSMQELVNFHFKCNNKFRNFTVPPTYPQTHPWTNPATGITHMCTVIQRRSYGIPLMYILQYLTQKQFTLTLCCTGASWIENIDAKVLV